jgi:ectoine hydroxylase-related dioxygenase (phytanoyl-CoA dioxygenase family)
MLHSSTAADSRPDPSLLSERGFEVVPGVLDANTLDRLKVLTDRMLAAQARDHFEQFRFHGSMVPLDALSEPAVADLVARPRLLAHFADLGFEDPRWMSAYLISKPPRSPSLWWHQDWWAWHDPVSSADFPPQMFVMYYLTDVGEENGALRVIPGSHRRIHPLAHRIPEAHSEGIGLASEQSEAHQLHPDEVTVAARAGDAVVGDVRLLHATHANRSDANRTCLTLWYLPAWDRLPEAIRAYVINHPSLPPRGWWSDPDSGVPTSLRGLLPVYRGSAAPADYCRTPPPARTRPRAL